MRAFADLYAALDETTRTTEKVRGPDRVFRPGPRGRRGLGGLLSHRPKAEAGGTDSEAPRLGGGGGGHPGLAVRGVYHAVGDLAETIALLLPPPVPRATSR